MLPVERQSFFEDIRISHSFEKKPKNEKYFLDIQLNANGNYLKSIFFFNLK